MNKSSARSLCDQAGVPIPRELVAQFADRMFPVVGASLDTIRLQNLGELPRGNVALTIYPATDDGEILIDQGIAIVAIVRSKNEYAIRLTFKHTTYPFSKMIIRFLSARQGIEPYHVKIGL